MQQSSRVAILTDPSHRVHTSIDWVQLGTVVTELSELYQTAKDRQLDIVLVEESRQDMTPAVVHRIRKFNGLTELWRIVSSHFGPDEHERVFDGYMPRDLELDGIAGDGGAVRLRRGGDERIPVVRAEDVHQRVIGERRRLE